LPVTAWAISGKVSAGLMRKRLFGTAVSIPVYIVNRARKAEKIKYNKFIKLLQRLISKKNLSISTFGKVEYSKKYGGRIL